MSYSDIISMKSSAALSEWFYFITGSNSPSLKDVCPQTSSMSERVQHAVFGDALKVITRLTEPVSPTDYLPDPESSSDEMIERSITGFDVTAMFAWSKLDICLAFDSLDSFLLNQGQIVAGWPLFVLCPLDEGPGFVLAEVSIVTKSTSRHCLDRILLTHLGF